MRIVVTGAAGFIGHRLCRVLAGQGHEITALVHPDSVERAKDLLAGSASQIAAADLAALSPADLPKAADAVVALGQARNFRDFPAKAEETFAVNVLANLTILQWAVGAGVQTIVHASSGGVYGGRKEGPLRESDLLAVDSPLGFYLGSKLCSEIVLQNYRQFFKGVAVLRPFFVYGPGQRKDMFVARMIDSVRNGLPIKLQGRDGLRTNPIYVDDAVASFAKALTVEGCQIFNIAGPEVVTLRELSELIGRKLDRRPVFEIDHAAQPVDYVSTTAQAERFLGPASMRLERGIELALQASLVSGKD